MKFIKISLLVVLVLILFSFISRVYPDIVKIDTLGGSYLLIDDIFNQFNLYFKGMNSADMKSFQGSNLTRQRLFILKDNYSNSYNEHLGLVMININYLKPFGPRPCFRIDSDLITGNLNIDGKNIEIDGNNVSLQIREHINKRLYWGGIGSMVRLDTVVDNIEENPELSTFTVKRTILYFGVSLRYVITSSWSTGLSYYRSKYNLRSEDGKEVIYQYNLKLSTLYVNKDVNFIVNFDNGTLSDLVYNGFTIDNFNSIISLRECDYRINSEFTYRLVKPVKLGIGYTLNNFVDSRHQVIASGINVSALNLMFVFQYNLESEKLNDQLYDYNSNIIGVEYSFLKVLKLRVGLRRYYTVEEFEKIDRSFVGFSYDDNKRTTIDIMYGKEYYPGEDTPGSIIGIEGRYLLEI